MAKFIFLQRGNCEERPPMTEEQMQEGMKAWMDWVQRGTKEGWLVDPGSPLSGDGAVVQPDSTITDGPFTEAKELVGGYTIVQADNLASACDLAKQIIQMAGGKIEVREIANMGP